MVVEPGADRSPGGPEEREGRLVDEEDAGAGEVGRGERRAEGGRVGRGDDLRALEVEDRPPVERLEAGRERPRERFEDEEAARRADRLGGGDREVAEARREDCRRVAAA